MNTPTSAESDGADSWAAVAVGIPPDFRAAAATFACRVLACDVRGFVVGFLTSGPGVWSGQREP